MGDRNERACTNCGSYLHHEDNCPTRSESESPTPEDRRFTQDEVKEIWAASRSVNERGGYIHNRKQYFKEKFGIEIKPSEWEDG